MARDKISSSNTFEGGLVSDLYEMTSPSNTVRDALNMEIITIGSDQYIYQNIRGNKHIIDLPSIINNNISYQFIPLGLKVHNDIAYILAGAFDGMGKFISGMIGTFPSPDWNKLNNEEPSELFETFSPLYNYKKAGSTTYVDPFISEKFRFSKNRFIDIVIQGDFDRSVNIIFTDYKENPNIINSRFKRTDAEHVVELANRAGDDDGNTYEDSDWDRIALIQNSNFPVTVKTFEIEEGGYLRGGGYRYYFKYITQEGNTTEVLYESPLIPISNGPLGLDKTQISDKMVRFELTDLDSSYKGIRVYFAHFDGKDAAAMEIFKINYVYSYSNDNSVRISHTGLEQVEPVDVSEINVSFTPIDTVKSIAIINDRLAIAGVTATIEEEDVITLEEAAKKITLWEKTVPIQKSYADPTTAAKSLGYWKGEVYEFAVVFMLTNKGLSPAFPITGMDNEKGIQSTYALNKYPSYTIDEDGFSNTDLINNKGLFRTSTEGEFFNPICGEDGKRTVTYLQANTIALKESVNLVLYNKLKKLVSGFFIVKRPRIRNVLMQGMAIPTLKLPAKQTSISEFSSDKLATFEAARIYLIKHFPNKLSIPAEQYPTLGLNAEYKSATDKGESMFNRDFPTVFVPQPTQILNALTFEKSWIVTGSLSQKITDTEFYTSLDSDGVDTKKMHIAFYSCEIELSFNTVKGYLNGINPALEIQDSINNSSPIGYTNTGFDFKDTADLLIRRAEGITSSNMISINSKIVRATILDSGTISFAKDSFTSKTDGAYGHHSDINPHTIVDEGSNKKKGYGYAYYPYKDRISTDYNIFFGIARGYTDPGIKFVSGTDTNRFRPYSIVAQSYSKYIGLEIDAVDSPTLPKFIYERDISSTITDFPNGNDNLICNDNTNDRYYTNIGHLANVFRSSTGRWSQSNIRDIFKYDSNKAYSTVTDREKIDKGTVDIFRGDGFISRLFKKITYKNGISESQSATAADAASFGIGITQKYKGDVDPIDIPEHELKDRGRGLLDVGQIIELVSYSNINADIRSIENYSDDETKLYGGERNFYPNKENLYGDGRPDSAAYNHGYTGLTNPISFNRIEENSPIFSTEFPNRVLLSERNKAQNYFNSFRDLKGYNFRDYGVEFGPIVKIIGINSILLTIHPSGVLAIGIDDRTLIAEGSDVFVNTAQALSPNSRTISDLYGSTHAESVVKTDSSVAGVDYGASIVWIFGGSKLSLISEFTVKLILDSFKLLISKGSFTQGDEELNYIPRVYSTFNYAKHTLYIAYIAEHPVTKEQFNVGNLSYNTVLEKWVSRLNEGNKFSLYIGADTYTTGFSSVKGIWKEDSLIDLTTGKSIRNRIRGIDYTYEFEIIVNENPTIEKVLDSIRIMTNKVIPTKIVYTTSEDENDAAIDIWGKGNSPNVHEQEVVTRNKSTRKGLRLGILDENAYYKNSGLYIEVNKTSSLTRKGQRTKRIRDKYIKIRFIYSGNDETFLQGIISILSISYS